METRQRNSPHTSPRWHNGQTWGIVALPGWEPMNLHTADADQPATAEVPSEDEQRSRALRRYVARHNQQAVLLAICSLVAAAILWGIIYLFAYWFSLVAITISRSTNVETINEINRPDLVSVYFPLWFGAGALATLAVAWVLRQRVRVERLREARWYALWVLAELFLAVPNVTFSIWGNLMALCRLRRQEAVEAWRLLRRMNEAGGRLSMTSLRTEIEDERTLSRVVFVLQLVGLVGVREYTHGWFLCLQSRDALALLGQPTN